ncbi:MAG: co-chaperone GroES [Deltaproteobacteria bacterium]|nr:co-chaperone GroES [Deltaproteobacteria bacterium]
MAKKNKTKVMIKSKSKSKPKSKPKLKAKTKSNAKPKVLTKGKLAKGKVATIIKGKSKVAPQVKTKVKVAPKAMPKAMSKTISKVMSKTMPTTKIKVSLMPAKKVMSKIDFQNWVTPLDDRLLVMISEGEKMTPGGLYIPDTVTDVSGNMKGVVAAVGRGHLDKKGKIRPLDVKKGDQVIFSQFSGSKIEYQGETVIFLRESDVLGIVNN